VLSEVDVVAGRVVEFVALFSKVLVEEVFFFLVQQSHSFLGCLVPRYCFSL
jgi:hypothetical protein